MIALRRIHDQAIIAIILLFAIVVALAVASIQGAMKFRSLSKSIQERSLELPKAAELGQEVSHLRSLLWELNHNDRTPSQFMINTVDRSDFTKQLATVELAVQNYEMQLVNSGSEDASEERTLEIGCVAEFKNHLDRIKYIIDEDEPTDWIWRQGQIYSPLENELSELQRLAAEIPISMQQRTILFAEEARNKYKAWIWVTAISGIAALLTLGGIVFSFNERFMKPLKILLNGSREVANGNYDHRVVLNKKDELAELGDALNSMTENFQAIQLDLNHQVQQRTKEVVRSEKMASVGFLAAGVAHEINNPLASIAWSAESLESRIHEILDPDNDRDPDQQQSEIEDMQKYLRRIQSEAFRVKEITGSLLDFSRMGDVQKKPVRLNHVIESVIDIVKPLSKYRTRNLLFEADEQVVVVVNEQEMKQVTLNLITNALGSVADSGTVTVSLKREGESAVLVVQDDGCGMDDEVKQHLFEPFFTRRRSGQGTGLGLSITYQIIEEHGGCILVHSDGVGQGSTFTIRLPLVKNEQKLSSVA
ncbi:MAG: HAMP domain-containing sensor histidine kinase [Planctomycetota bacterium]